MANEKSYQSSDSNAPNHGVQDVTAPILGVDARTAGSQTPLEVETDYDSSLAGSGFLEGSWATVSSETGVSRIDELGSSEDEGEDNASELSPRHTASAVHSESEIDAFSDSQSESDDVRPREDRTYEYVTDQSWTDPDKSTPSNSTISTFPGSYSRGLAAARTPAHSQSSTLTRARLTEHSRYQWIDAQAQPLAVSQTELGDSQVELVFPRIAGDFGTGSVDTITSATPLLPIEETPVASEVEAKQHNFRPSASQQLPEDDYIFLADSFDEPRSRNSSSIHVASGPTTHHAFPANPVDRRRSEKWQGIDVVRDGVIERGKRRLYSDLGDDPDDTHAESRGRESSTEQKQLDQHVVGEVAERVIDSDADGYERLSLEEASADLSPSLLGSVSQDHSFLEARLIGPRTRCPVNQGWLDALSAARSQGLILVDEPRSFATEDGLSDSLGSREKLPFDLTASRQRILDDSKWANTMGETPSRPVHLGRKSHVRRIFSIVAVPLLMIVVLSQLTVVQHETEVAAMPPHAVDDYAHAVHDMGSRQSSTGCAAVYSTYGAVTTSETGHACAASPPIGSTAPHGQTPCHLSQPILNADAPPDDQDGSISSSASTVKSASLGKNLEPAVVNKYSTLATSVALTGPPLHARRRIQTDPAKRMPRHLQDPFADYVDCDPPDKSDGRMLESPTAYNVFHLSNTSRVTRLVELSLSMTTAMDRAIRAAHGNLLDFLAKYEVTWSRTGPIRNSGRRIFNSHFGGLFDETDALKQRLRTEMSDLLDAVDDRFQDLTVEVDKAIRLSKEGLVKKLKETADALEKHIGVEIPLPASMARDPGRNRTKPTVSTWAEKFWQTLHHATVTLII